MRTYEMWRRTAVLLLAAVVGSVAHMGWDLSGMDETGVERTAVELVGTPQRQEAPAVVWDVSGAEPTEFPHEAVLEASAGAFRVEFTTADRAARQGLVSVNANGEGAGGHYSLYIEDGGLRLRMQADSTSGDELWTDPLGSLAAGTVHEAVTTWGPDGAQVYLDGQRVGAFAWDRGLQGNREPVVIGGLQWTSSPGTADRIVEPIDGDVTRAEMYDSQLTAAEVASLAAGDDDTTAASFSLRVTARWPAAQDDGPVTYRWRVEPTSGWSGEAFAVADTTDVTRAEFGVPFDPDGTSYNAQFCVLAADTLGQTNQPRCVTFMLPAQPDVDLPPGPIDSVDVQVEIDTVMAMAPERDRAWVYARWAPDPGAEWYRVAVHEASTGQLLSWTNENNWVPHDDQRTLSRGEMWPWATAGLRVPRRSAAYEAELVVTGYPAVSRTADYGAWPVPLEPVEQGRWRWTVPAAGTCRDYDGDRRPCRST